MAGRQGAWRVAGARIPQGVSEAGSPRAHAPGSGRREGRELNRSFFSLVLFLSKTCGHALSARARRMLLAVMRSLATVAASGASCAYPIGVGGQPWGVAERAQVCHPCFISWHQRELAA